MAGAGKEDGKVRRTVGVYDRPAASPAKKWITILAVLLLLLLGWAALSFL